MTVKTLSNTTFDELLDCFLLAFENYFVEMPTDKNYYKERWTASKVDFNYSYGMFDDERLVGFIIHSIDNRFGTLMANNSGTGVIPEYRGRRVVNTIYEFALNDLKQKGIKKSTLDVITENKKAIKAYENAGFKICKTYLCYNGTINLENEEPFELEEVSLDKIDWSILPNQDFYSWDNQKESVLNGNYFYYQIVNNGTPESYFIIKPNSGYIAQFDVLATNKLAWSRLFSAIKSISNTIKINNVDNRLVDKINVLNQLGLKNTINQYEMELILNA